MGTQKKLPAIQFYTGDWLKDPALSMCSPATRGIWIDFLCAAHEFARSGQITGTPDQLARICRCTAAELVAAANELQITGTADVRERNGEITIINRRMKREYDQRLATAERVHKHRCNTDVTRQKRECNIRHVTSSSSSSSEEKTNVSSSQKDMPGASVPGVPADQVRAIFAYWQMRMKHPQSKLTSDRRGKIEARLREGYEPDQIKTAIDGCLISPYHQGGNDAGAIYDDIELICRNGSKLENFIRIAEQHGGTGNGKALHGTRSASHRETHNERAARETAELIEQAFAPPGGDSGADPADAGEDGIAVDFRRV